MLKQSYQYLLETQSGFKTQVKKVIYDIDERLKGIQSGKLLEGIFSKVDHNHDANYSAINHRHDELYSNINHTHPEYVRKDIDTAFNSDMLGMKTVDEFALKGHKHSNMVYITKFAIPTLREGNVNVSLELDVDKNHYYILDNDANFNFISCSNNTLSLKYSFDENNQQNMFVVLYWTDNPRDDGTLIQTKINVSDVTVIPEEECTLTSIVTNQNGIPVSKGTVDYEIKFND